jgi:magnesium chelatase accessory protein
MLDFDRDGRDWPNRAASRFARAGGLSWHVQIAGEGPEILLLHGTGASTHSWRDVFPDLARDFRVIAPDLPGHAFTGRAPAGRLTLPGMAHALEALVDELGVAPKLVVGHSAGAAIGARMILDKRVAPAALVSLAGAFMPFRGVATQFFSPIAKLLFMNPFVPWMFATRASDRSVVESLLANTGSRVDAAGVAAYARLAADSGHVAGALGMMASWNLRPLERDMPRLPCPLVVVVPTEDRTIPPSEGYALAGRVKGAELVKWRGLGHLAHEEKPREAAELIRRVARDHGVLPSVSARLDVSSS